MKKTLFALAIILSFTSLRAQTSYYAGEWTVVNKQELFKCVMQLRIKNKTTVTAKLIWTYLSTDSTSAELMDIYQGKKGKRGMEIVEGTYDKATNDIYFTGVKKIDPHNVIGLDKYTLKLSADKKAIYGKTDSNGQDNGLFYAHRMDQKTGKKRFYTLRKQIR